MTTKKCKTCGIDKVLSEFGKHANCINGVRPSCKKCTTEKQSQYQKENREKYIEYQRKHYSENKDQYKEYRVANRTQKRAWANHKYQTDENYRDQRKKEVKEYRKRYPHKKRESDIKRQYGLSISQLDEILSSQNNSCAICGFVDNGDKKMFPHIDHCHKTGAVRGLLCTKCNMGIGQFGDNVETLKKAIAYLGGGDEEENNNMV